MLQIDKPSWLERHIVNIIAGACMELGRSSYGFEVSKLFYCLAKDKMLSNVETQGGLFDNPAV